MSDELAVQLAELLGEEITGLRRLSGGASRETWSFDAGARLLILQRQRGGGGGTATPMPVEVAALRAAAVAGVPVPSVVADATDGAALGNPAFVVERLEGETIARKLLRDDEYAAVRPTLAARCGEALAAIHGIPVDSVPGLRAVDPLESMVNTLADLGEPHPAFELAIRWLDRNRPATATGPVAVVHGDFRTGNLMIDGNGVVAVLDWELTHLGDPMEDLGWFCARAWRFGVDDKPAGGFGSREELWAAYEAAGGAPVDPEAARWWELFGTLKWGVICIIQAASHWLGFSRSMELAAIGRRASENEHDVLALLAPDAVAPTPTVVDGTTGTISVSDRPTAAELAEAVREWLETDVAEGTDGRLRFHTRVAVNAVAMLEREARLGSSHIEARRRRHEALGVSSEAELADGIRSGRYDDRWDEVLASVWSTVVDKLEGREPRLRRRQALTRRLDQMRIGILGGTGPAGSALAARLASVGFETVVGSRSKYRAMEAVDQLLEQWPDRKLKIDAGDNADAANGDVVVLATPWDGATQTAVSVRDHLQGKVVISMANALTRIGKEFQPLVPPRGSVAASVQAAVPGCFVAAAFHHVPAKELGDLDHPIETDVLICSDFPQATDCTSEIVAKIPNMRPLDAGELSLATPIESFTAVLLQLNVHYKTRVALRFTGLDRVGVPVTPEAPAGPVAE